MNRRAFLTTAAAAALAPALAQAAQIAYTEGALQRVLASGSPVVLDYYADWCPTCHAQRRVISQLMSENADYKDKVTYIEVDWDTYKSAPITTDFKVPRRSTLIAVGTDGNELARVVAQTGYDEIKALFDAALSSATS